MNTETDPIEALRVPITLPPAPYELAGSKFLASLAYCENQIAALDIRTPDDAQAAADMLTRLTKAGRMLEEARTTLKAPFIAAGRAIDDAAKEPAKRIEEAKSSLKAHTMRWQVEQDRKAEATEALRQQEIARLEKIAAEEAKRKAAEEAAAAELARKQDAPPEDDLPPMDDMPETVAPAAQAVLVAKAAATPEATKPTGLKFTVTLRAEIANIMSLPEAFVIRTPDMHKIRTTYCRDWREGDDLPECAGVKFVIDRQVVSTGRRI